MNVLLVRPWEPGYGWASSHAVGLACLAASLRQAGHEVSLLDARFSRLSSEATRRALLARRPDLVGITAMTHEMPRAEQIIRWSKSGNPEGLVVLGGPHATVLPEQTLSEIPELDFTISGEGEGPLLALIDALAGAGRLEEIAGLGFRRGHEVVLNGAQSGFVDLASQPPPATDLYYEPGFFDRHPERPYYLCVFRGCPFQCAFCSKALGRKVRGRTADSVMEELRRAAFEYRATRICFTDETFFYDTETVRTILQRMIDEGLAGWCTFKGNTHVNCVQRDVLELAWQAGFREISIGIESGNDEILKRIRRPYTIEKASRAVETLKSVGFQVHCYFILGHPGENHRTALDTLRAAVRMNPDTIGLGVMVPYPGTRIYELARQGRGGYRLNDTSWASYDRYGGGVLEFDGLPRQHIILYQVAGYAALYLFNGRLRDLGAYFAPRFHTLVRLGLGALRREGLGLVGRPG